MIDKFPLCPAVALAEWMQGVDLAKIISGAFAERGNIQPFQIIFFRELLKNRPRRAFDMRVIGKIAVALGKVDVPKFTSPFIHILKQVLVNSFQVIEVKTAMDRFLEKLKPAPRS